MKKRTSNESPILRERIPYGGLAMVLVIVAMTLGSAGANLIPMDTPTHEEIQRAEQAETSAVRRQHLAAMVITGDNCKPVIAAQIAKLLVFDGQSARAYTNDFARRCGEIESVSRWGTIMPPDKTTSRVYRHFAAL